MLVHVYHARLVELNQYLRQFPDADNSSPLSEDDLKEVFEYGLPRKWRMHMTMTRFVPAEVTMEIFLDFVGTWKI